MFRCHLCNKLAREEDRSMAVDVHDAQRIPLSIVLHSLYARRGKRRVESVG